MIVDLHHVDDHLQHVHGVDDDEKNDHELKSV
jgi:hypothetical protein